MSFGFPIFWLSVPKRSIFQKRVELIRYLRFYCFHVCCFLCLLLYPVWSISYVCVVPCLFCFTFVLYHVCSVLRLCCTVIVLFYACVVPCLFCFTLVLYRDCFVLRLCCTVIVLFYACVVPWWFLFYACVVRVSFVFPLFCLLSWLSFYRTIYSDVLVSTIGQKRNMNIA